MTKAERLHYTLVLKGHIAIARALLPKGSCGGELDLLARTPLLRHGLDYLHGTGHGVGYGLSVHEGPHSCSARGRVPLAPGMRLKNEPGYYEPGRHGIRIENMTVIEASPPVGDRALHRVRTLGCCPIDLRPADPALLTGEERDWLNDYHAWVRRMLTPLFPAAERPWLKNATRLI